MAAFAVLLSCGSVAQPETHLLPSGFVGEVVIIFGVADGEAAAYQDGRRVYRIPTSGILRTQFTLSEGWLDAKYFYVDASGAPSIEIRGRSYSTIHDTPENRANPEVGILNPSNGVVGACIPGTDVYSSEAPCAVSYKTYFVGRRADILQYEARFDVSTYLQTHPVPCDR